MRIQIKNDNTADDRVEFDSDIGHGHAKWMSGPPPQSGEYHVEIDIDDDDLIDILVIDAPTNLSVTAKYPHTDDLTLVGRVVSTDLDRNLITISVEGSLISLSPTIHASIDDWVQIRARRIQMWDMNY